MSKFEETKWANTDFSQNYRDKADTYLPFRRRFIDITKSYYEHFVSHNTNIKVLDLGCGDGLFADLLLKSYSPAEVLLVDGSAEMLKAAKERLGYHPNVKFIQANFQELIANDPLNQAFNFIFSSLAIHHLSLPEKKKLYSYIHGLLSPGGHFVHYDVVLPPSGKLETWYLSLWRQWIMGHPDKERREGLLGIPEQYKANLDNTPDALEAQLDALGEAGFTNVDCFFKYGIFSLFGGSR